MRRALVAAAVLAAALPGAARAAAPSMAAVDAAARAAGNRLDVARALGTRLFGTIWPAQITKVRVDGVGAHLVAGVVLSGVKFHRALDDRAFLDEVAALAARTLAMQDIEEVDLWTTVPLRVPKGLPVSGDYAAPTAKTVFAVTVPRASLGGLRARLGRGDGVFWDPAFLAALRARRTAAGPGQLRVVVAIGTARVS